MIHRFSSIGILRFLPPLFCLLTVAGICTASAQLQLAKDGKALASVMVPVHPTVTEEFAGRELCRYLQKISGAAFRFSETRGTKPALILQLNQGYSKEQYSIAMRGGDLVLQGGSGRALLYAVYDFLHRLGCTWLAPQFNFYKGEAEIIPRLPVLSYEVSHDIIERPQFKYRKLDVEEGRSHTIENLKQLIDWMPKVRLNTFMVPLNYQGNGRVQWDNWNTDLTPELKKRGLLIEVGGHGYQNFLNAKMEAGTLFRQHPEWFGVNKNNQPDPALNLVFNTSNQEAVHYFLSNLQAYIRRHPEIDIFDLWPPDVARWAESPQSAQLGTPADRQAMLVNTVDSAIKTMRPDLRLEIIAYGQVLQPPKNVKLNPGILVDICPINQSFETPVFEAAQPNNAAYTKSMLDWRKNFSGAIGLYSYYRKYAWHSLPVVIPHYIQKELQWYNNLSFCGISTYAEPADWYTYELNHYALAALAWNPLLSIDSLVSNYCSLRYGSSAPIALSAYSLFENLIPHYSSIPFTTPKSKEEIEQAKSDLIYQKNKIDIAIMLTHDLTTAAHLERLSLMLNFASLDLEIMQQKVSHVPDRDIETRVTQLVALLDKNREKGIFLLGENGLNTFLKHYSTK